MKNLVIVESLAKAKTIEKYLNTSKVLKPLGAFKVVASFGHIDNLPPKELGIDIDAGFAIKYQLLSDKKKVTDGLKTAAKDADVVWIASDADFEGEKIADSLRSFLKLKNYKRVTFTEITQQALERALQNPREIDKSMVDAQETRRVLDRLVGYKLSPLLWKRYTGGSSMALSAGRVQSAVMHALIEREVDIENFKSESYWYFHGDFTLHKKVEDVKLFKAGRVHKVDRFEEAHGLLKGLRNHFSIKGTSTKAVRQSSDLPYTTSSFQQDAYSKLGMGIKRSMQIAQELYENGHITYMRTDSYNISDVFKEGAQSYVKNTYGDAYWDGRSRQKKAKNAQEAHEAIRPSNVDVRELPGGGKVTGEHKRVYDLIWKRAVASLLKPAVFDELHAEVVDSSFPDDMCFLATEKRLRFNGYLVVYGFESEQYDLEATRTEMKTVVCERIVAKNTWSGPPQRFNDSSLVKMMEAEGIGRPSTYASILQKLTEKNYVNKTDIAGKEKVTKNLVFVPGKSLKEDTSKVVVGAEKNRMVPTEIGREIDTFLDEKFPYIVDRKFTSTLEGDLDLVAEGSKMKIDVLNVFWGRFGQDVQKEGSESKGRSKTKLETQKKEIKLNGKSYTIRLAKYGPVIEHTVDGQKKYIGLGQYIKYARKEYMDVNENDVTFLTRLPIVLKGSKGEEVAFQIGPYGLYGKSVKGNHKVPLKLALEFINNNGTMDPDAITKVVEYEKKPPK